MIRYNKNNAIYSAYREIGGVFLSLWDSPFPIIFFPITNYGGMGEIRTYIRDDCLQTAIEAKSVVAVYQSAVREKNHTKKIIAAKASDVINYTNNTHVITDYRYDSFGRRIHTAERTKSGMRTIYDGLSFEVVKEAETFLGTRGITLSATGEAKVYFQPLKWRG